MLLAGGGVKGGRVVGASDRSAHTRRPSQSIRPTFTPRYCITGLEPEQTMYDLLRRPYPLSHGKPIAAIM
ncbi:MAG: DUF1501 domain-containing protein [Gemmataceae bacterium]